MKSIAINAVVLPLLLALIVALAAACAPKPGSRLPKKPAAPTAPVANPLTKSTAEAELQEIGTIEKDLKASADVSLDGSESFKLALATKTREDLKAVAEKLERVCALGASAQAKGDNTKILTLTSAEKARAWVRDRISRVDEYRESAEFGAEIDWDKWKLEVDALGKSKPVHGLKLVELDARDLKKIDRLDRKRLGEVRSAADKSHATLVYVIRGHKAQWQFEQADKLAARLKRLKELRAALAEKL